MRELLMKRWGGGGEVGWWGTMIMQLSIRTRPKPGSGG